MTVPGKPGDCATASTPPHSASSRPTTWNEKATAPIAGFSNRPTTPEPHRSRRAPLVHGGSIIVVKRRTKDSHRREPLGDDVLVPEVAEGEREQDHRI